MKKGNKKLGNLGELIAKIYLEKIGYEFVESKFLIRGGELDLIFSHSKKLIIVEVKSRKSFKFGQDDELISPRKKQFLLRTANNYIEIKKLNIENNKNIQIQFDLVCVTFFGLNKVRVKHYQNIFEE